MQHDIKKVTTKDRYGNQISYEFEAPVKPLDQTAIVKEMMKETADMNGMNIEVPEIDIDGHPGEPRGSDTVPAWLTPGEFVVNAEAMRIPGAQEIVEDINDQGRAIQQEQGGSIPGYDIGGKVSKLYKEGYTAPGQAYAIAKDMGYQEGGMIPAPFIAGPRLNDPQYQDDGGWITEELLDRLAEVESGVLGNKAVSPAGAVGKYQWLPSSAKKAGYGVKAFDPLDEIAARAATKKYLKNMQKYHGFTPEETLRAYNWGPGNVINYNKGKRKDIPAEALNYPGKILGVENIQGVPVQGEMPLPTPRPQANIPTPTPRPQADAGGGWKDFLNNYILGEKTQLAAGGGMIPQYYQTGNIVPEIKTDGHAMFGGTQNLGGGVHPLAKRPEGIIGNDTNIVTDEAPVYEPSFWDKYVLGPQTKDERALTDADKGFLDAKTAESEKLAAAQVAEEENQIADEYVPVQDVESDIIEGSGTKEGTGDSLLNHVDDMDPKFKKEIKQKTIEKIDQETSDAKSVEEDDKTVEAAGNQDPDKVKSAEGFLKGIFGDLFDSKELKRAAIMYLGSRALGYNHQGSLRHSMKNYITRVDTKAANLDKKVLELAKSGKYSPASIQAFKESGDVSALQPVGVKANALGNFKTFFKNGKQVQAQEYKVGDSKVWQTADGRIVDASYTSDASTVKGTPAYGKRIKQDSAQYTGMINDLRKQFGTIKTDAGDQYKTELAPSVAGNKIAKWAADNGVPPEYMGSIVENAYHSALTHSQNTGEKVRDLTPFLEEQYVVAKVGDASLFKKEDGRPVSGTVVSKLIDGAQSAAIKLGGKTTQHDILAGYRKAWNNLSEKERKQWNAKAGEEENGFVKFMQTDIYKSL